MIQKLKPLILRGRVSLRTCSQKKVLTTLLLLCLLLPEAKSADAPSPSADTTANRIVSGIISFTHWPGKTGLPRLCVFSSAKHIAFSADAAAMTPARSFNVTYITDWKNRPNVQCDAIYFGRETPRQQSAILATTAGKPTLSIAENNPECTLGAVFCLLVNQTPPAFSVNLDSLSRSGVRVSPDVLLLSRKGY